MPAAKVTVIVPVYNAGTGLYRCVDSLIGQSCRDFKVLLIDDGSTDDSWKRICQICQDNPDLFRGLTQDNCGVCDTRHRGILEADTEFVMFMDNDDFIDPNYVETLLKLAQSSDADIVVSGCRRTTGLDTKFTVKLTRHDAFAPYLMTAPWARLFRRSLLVENDIRFLEAPIGEDAYFNLSCYLYTDKILTTDYVGYNWFYNDESVSNTKQRGLNQKCDPLILLNALDELYASHNARNPVFDYFIYRYVVWYLLWSGKTATRTRFLAEYRRLYFWLNQKGYKLKMHWFSRCIASDKLFNRLCISAFDLLATMRLVPLFSLIYCKPEF